jgi:hypothetical protein
MSTIITTPSPVIINSPATLTYTKPGLILVPGAQYVIQNTSGTSISSTFTGPVATLDYSTPNEYNATFYSSTVVDSYGNAYTSMYENPYNQNQYGFIQVLSSITAITATTNIYYQFSNGTNSLTGYPSGLAIDSNGRLYFLCSGNSNLYYINITQTPGLNPPATQFNTNSTGLTGVYTLAINPNTNYFYVTSSNCVGQIDASGNATILNSTASQASYGICCDNNNNLYIGFTSGIIGKYNLTSSTFTPNFSTLTGENFVVGLTFISSSNIIIANTFTSSNNYGDIYAVSLQGVNLFIQNYNLLGTIGLYSNFITGATQSAIQIYEFSTSPLTFNNLVLSNPGTNLLNIYNNF